MRYIDLNMMRAGVIRHPKEWPWCGYQEIAGRRQRYRILDLEELLRLSELEKLTAFAEWYDAELDKSLETASMRREPHWTESSAVGSKDFVRRIAALSKNRKRLEVKECVDDSWYVREPEACYASPVEATPILHVPWISF